MRLSIKQVLLILLAVAFWVFNVFVWLSVIASVVAWFISESSLGILQLGSTSLDFQQMKDYLQGTKVSFSPIYEGLALLATLVTTPAAIGLWKRATTINITEINNGSQAAQNTPDTAELIQTIIPQVPEQPNKVASRARIAGVTEERIRDRNRLLNATRLQLIALTDRNSVWDNWERLTYRSCRTKVLAGSKRPYLILVIRREISVLEPQADILDLVAETKNWRLIIGRPDSQLDCSMLLETEVLKECLDRAQKDTNAPVPVIVELYQWENTSTDFEVWIVNFLTTKYGISRESAKSFITNNRLVLVFFGHPKNQFDAISMFDKFSKFWSSSPTSCILFEFDFTVETSAAIAAANMPYLPSDATLYLREPG